MWAFQHFGKSSFCSYITFWLGLSFLFLPKFQSYIWIPAAHNVCILQHHLCNSAVRVFYIITPAFWDCYWRHWHLFWGSFSQLEGFVCHQLQLFSMGDLPFVYFVHKLFLSTLLYLLYQFPVLWFLMILVFASYRLAVFLPPFTVYGLLSPPFSFYWLQSAVSQWLNYCSTGSDQHS